MRSLLFAVSTIAALAVPGAASAQYYYEKNTYVAPPVVAPAAPLVEREVYLAPGAAYVAPGAVYDDQAVIIDGQRYYKDCWWDWGRRRCEYKPWPQ